MYQEYYQLKENPFNVTADPSFFFWSSVHADALANLIYGIEERKGISLVTGEIGTGKTTVCRMLLRKLNTRTKTALILNPRFSDIELLRVILKDLGLSSNYQTKFELINTLNDFLINESNNHNNVVIVIDEAQNLGINELEQIRLLSNLETEKQKLLQIVLVGQPELSAKLKQPELRQLNQRIIVRVHLKPLTSTELKDYIVHRLDLARSHYAQPGVEFSTAAVDAIFYHTRGTPRMVNILCDRALLAGYVREATAINEELINQCAQEVFVE